MHIDFFFVNFRRIHLSRHGIAFVLGQRSKASLFQLKSNVLRNYFLFVFSNRKIEQKNKTKYKTLGLR